VVAIAVLRPAPRRAPNDEAGELLALELATELETVAVEFVDAAAALLLKLGADGADGAELGDLLAD
jgi:hypothetical protein